MNTDPEDVAYDVASGHLFTCDGTGIELYDINPVNGTFGDFGVKTDVERGLMKAELLVRGDITTTVYDGRVLLTGHVPSQEIKTAAQQIASKTHDVRAVYDEIEVADTGGVWNDANDAWITAQLRSQLVIEPEVRSVNYTIDTANGSVYLIGSARSQAELDRATQVARMAGSISKMRQLCSDQVMSLVTVCQAKLPVELRR